MANTVIRIGYVSVSSGSGGGGIQEYSSIGTFPLTGVAGIIYLALDTNKIYRWSGVAYVEMSPSEVTSVNTEVGAVVLDKSDIGLGNVDNTSDLNKPISTATQNALDDLDERIVPIEDRDEVVTVYAYENNTQVYADGQPGIKDPSALIRDGWYFKNSIAGQKINWYYFDGTSQGTVTLGELKSSYAIITFDAVSGAAAPIIAIYTVPTGTGDIIPGFAHSRVVYDGPMTPTPVVGKQYLVYAGENPPVHPELPRINLALIPGLSIGDKLPSEQILTISFGSSSGAGVNQIQYMVETLGLFSNPVKHEMDLRIRQASKLELDTAISNVESSLVYSQVVYVDKNKAGTYTPDGSITKPYKSIEAMYTAITDASASKRYACLIAPGTYIEASTIQMKGWIDLTALATDTVIISVSGGATLKWSNNSPGRVFVKDIGFAVGLETLNDNPTGTSGVVFDLDNVDAPSLVFRGRGGGVDFIQLRNDTRISANCTIQSASVTIFDSTNISTLTMNDVGCVVPDEYGSAITASIRSNYIGNISISATTYDIYTDIWGTIIAGNLTIASNASSYPCYFNYDATSYPLGTVTLTGTNPAQLVRTSVAQSIRFTPAVSGNWAAPAPTEVKAALDSLAANKISSSEKGTANGVAPLNASTKIDATYLPSYVDDVVEYANLAAFPSTGETGKIYVALDTNKVYRWSGSAYVEIAPSPALTWGSITGSLSSQTDLQSALDGKFDDPTGTTAQYIRGDGSLATFPTSTNQANSLVTTVFNNSGAPIPKFSVVYINGGQGDMPTIALAQANNEANSSKTYGVVYADIPNMQSGQVIVNGALTGLNTDQFNPTAPMGNVNGVALYLSPTVPGGLTTTKPFAPNHMVYVATIVRTHQNEGVVEVRIQNGFELQELHNVQILNGSAANNQVLKYDFSTSLWKNQYIGLEYDIEQTSFSISNNQTLPANITGLSFSSTNVRSFTAFLSIYVDATTDLFEIVEIAGINKNGTFEIAIKSTGDISGIEFSITNSGQLQYTSPNFSGFVSGVMKFRALTTSV